MVCKSKRQLSHSQNFLKNSVFVKRLLDKTDIKSRDLIIEIGPGKGIITKQLSKKVKKVIAIEKDFKLVKNLREMFTGQNNIKIVNTDFLKWELPSKPYKVFSNIPFNMTADIICKLLEAKYPPKRAYLILQDKAAERFIGQPMGKDTQTSILLKPYFEMKSIFSINRKQFTPEPKVNAVLVEFKKRQKSLVKKEQKQLFRDFVIYGYNQWKLTIMKNFEKIFSSKQQAILSKRFDIREAKPRDLDINKWLKLFESFLEYVPAKKQAIVRSAELRLKNQQKKLQKQHRTRKQ